MAAGNQADTSGVAWPTTTLWVNMVVGRTVSQKRELVKELAGAVSSVIGCSEDSVVIYIREASKENAAKGGVLLADS